MQNFINAKFLVAEQNVVYFSQKGTPLHIDFIDEHADKVSKN